MMTDCCALLQSSRGDQPGRGSRQEQQGQCRICSPGPELFCVSNMLSFTSHSAGLCTLRCSACGMPQVFLHTGLCASLLRTSRPRTFHVTCCSTTLENGSGLMAHTQRRASRLAVVCSAQHLQRPLVCAEAWPLLNHAVVFLKLASRLRSCSLAMQIMIGVQHFAHFYLTLLLVDKMKESTSSSTPIRIVFTTSASEATGQADIPWDNLG